MVGVLEKTRKRPKCQNGETKVDVDARKLDLG